MTTDGYSDDERDQRRVRGIVRVLEIGLVDEDGRRRRRLRHVLDQPLDVGRGDDRGRRVVRVADVDEAAAARLGQHGVQIELQVAGQGHLVHRHLCLLGEAHRLLVARRTGNERAVFRREGAHRRAQQISRATRQHDSLGGDAVCGGDRLDELRRHGAGVAMAFERCRFRGVDGGSRRTVGILVAADPDRVGGDGGASRRVLQRSGRSRCRRFEQ